MPEEKEKEQGHEEATEVEKQNPTPQTSDGTTTTVPPDQPH